MLRSPLKVAYDDGRVNGVSGSCLGKVREGSQCGSASKEVSDARDSNILDRSVLRLSSAAFSDTREFEAPTREL